MHSWKDTLDYSSNTMESAVQYEKFMNVGEDSVPPSELSFGNFFCFFSSNLSVSPPVCFHPRSSS